MKRIQISRQHKDPPNTRRCTRPGKWGNDFKVGEKMPGHYYRYVDSNYSILTVEESIRLYKTYQLPTYTDDDLRELLQYENLGCFCKLENPCHVDALIEEMKKRELNQETWLCMDAGKGKKRCEQQCDFCGEY